MSEGKKVAFLVANEGVERVELVDPWDAVERAGHQPRLLSLNEGTVTTFDHLDASETQHVDEVVANADPQEYDALVLPGGVANPDALRQDPAAVEFVRRFMASGRPVAAICHAPWTLIEAGVVEGRNMTSWPSLKTDLRNAGAEWVDEELVVDGNLITSRKPDDLPAFVSSLLDALERAT